MASSCSRPLLLAFVFLLLQVCCALELQEIRPWQAQARRSRFGKRDTSGLDLRNVESFLWGGADNTDAVLGNFTVYVPGDHEHILSMEKFDGMLESVDCTPNGMTLKFEDDQTFAYAQRAWDWVNGADNHTFLMVAGRGDCGNNTRRIPYLVSSIEYDEDLNIARLNATTGEWKSLAHSYELQVGSVAMSGQAGLKMRDITKDVAMNIATAFPFKVKVEKGRISAELECDEKDCHTTGKINFEFRITQNVIGVPDGARFRMTPRGVTAQARLKLNVASNFDSQKELWKETVLSIPLNSINIPGNILEIGPFLDIDVGGELTGFEGSVSIISGATATLSNSAVLQADLLNPKNNEFSGWLPSVDVMPLTIEAKVAATMQVFVMPAVRMRIEALGKGVEAGLQLKMPFFEIKMEGVAAASGGVCNDPTKTLGVEIKPSCGVEIKFAAGKSNSNGKAPVDVTLGRTFSAAPTLLAVAQAAPPMA
ncbi:hypothetical protein H2201_005334 [Coniosporium apollinis]|uniref:Uncharacterized protein n=1 Tax=Coniosporium apollinis TaxID=61459 RepID=A0ABQ9NQ79_9PEZI|nr:hypothetical protein H2201_005334 [Coniosporium apollinis]